MEEIWKDIYFIENGIEWDYRNLYQVSNLGRIKSLNYKHTGKEKILKNKKNKKNYHEICLFKNGKRKYFLVHRLVAFMFIENDDIKNKIDVNHIDENPSNNYVNNLEWCTKEYNINYGNRNKKVSNLLKDKKLSDEHKQKLKENHADFKGVNHPNLGLLIDRFDINGNYVDSKYRFEYVEMGFNGSHISSCCKGKRKTHKGFIFKYHKEN